VTYAKKEAGARITTINHKKAYDVLSSSSGHSSTASLHPASPFMNSSDINVGSSLNPEPDILGLFENDTEVDFFCIPDLEGYIENGILHSVNYSQDGGSDSN
jgi:hypothetical protein